VYNPETQKEVAITLQETSNDEDTLKLEIEKTPEETYQEIIKTLKTQ
jgi:hypothetical protein